MYFDADYVSGGLFVSRDTWIHPTRTIDSNEIIYVIKGTVRMFEENRRFELHKGDCLILEKGKRHGGYDYNDDEVSFYWFHFQTDFPSLSVMKNVSFRSGDGISLLSKQLLHSANTPAYSNDATNCFLRLVLNEIYLASNQSTDSAYPVCGVISEWITRNSDKKIAVEEISKKFGYNKDYISRAFKKHFGVSLKNFIDDERIKFIKSLLLTTGYPLKQISEMTGFPDYKSFLKFFSYHDEVTPQEYRHKYFNTHINHE